MLRERVLGIYPNERKEVVGTQAEVLAASAPDGVYGVCEDTGAVLTRAGGVWVPSATLSFATKEALDAAVAANGGQSLGLSVSVAGVLWDWNGVDGYGPTQTTFATLSALLASPDTGTPKTVSGSPGCSLVLKSDGKYHGSIGEVSQSVLGGITTVETDKLADGVTAYVTEWPDVEFRLDPVTRGWVPGDPPACGTRTNIHLAVIGQSNEQGSFRTWNAGTNPSDVQFGNVAYADPVSGQSPNRLRGSIWPSVASLLSSRKVRVRSVYNGAVGSVNMMRDVCGVLFNFNSWAANTTVYQYRASEGTGDNGDTGDYIWIPTGNKLFRCITGTKRYATINSPSSPITISGTPYKYLDFLAYGPTITTGATTPSWASATVIGNTVSDGSAVWELVSTSYTPGALSVINAQIAAYGQPYFDPLGIVNRALTAADPGYTKVLYLQNGQSNTQSSSAQWDSYRDKYAAAFREVAKRARTLDYTVFIGNSSGNPSETILDNGYYPSQMAQVAATKAVTDQASPYVVRGADWFAEFGNAPPCWPESGTADSGVRVHLEARAAFRAARTVASSIVTGLGY